MIATKPAVQTHVSRIKRYCCCGESFAYEKRIANRRHRRELNH